MKPKDILIAIDDGHGMETPGKQTPMINGAVVKENQFNGAVAKYLDSALKRCGFKTMLTAPGNRDVSLSQRVKSANNARADVFVSIHYNAFRGNWDETAGGKETHYYKPDSLVLAETVHKHIIKGTPQINRGVKKTNYYVLRTTNMPSILIEHGFMDVRKEAKLMLNKEFQTEEAEQICQGLCEYFNVPYIGGENMTHKEIIRACAVIIERLIKGEDIELQAKYLRELFDKEGV